MVEVLGRRDPSRSLNCPDHRQALQDSSARGSRNGVAQDLGPKRSEGLDDILVPGAEIAVWGEQRTGLDLRRPIDGPGDPATGGQRGGSLKEGPLLQRVEQGQVLGEATSVHAGGKPEADQARQVSADEQAAVSQAPVARKEGEAVRRELQRSACTHTDAEWPASDPLPRPSLRRPVVTPSAEVATTHSTASPSRSSTADVPPGGAVLTSAKAACSVVITSTPAHPGTADAAARTRTPPLCSGPVSRADDHQCFEGHVSPICRPAPCSGGPECRPDHALNDDVERVDHRRGRREPGREK